MNISNFGAGYVGAVTAACLAKSGHSIIAVDVSKEKVDELNRGISPIVEHNLDVLIKDAVDAGRLRATTAPNVGFEPHPVCRAGDRRMA